MQDWDDIFGEAIAPRYISEVEIRIAPRSLCRLDDASAGLLRQLMEIADQGLGVARLVYSETPILWVVDEGGSLWFALEEIVDPLSGEFRWPRFRQWPAGQGEKLGHPALISGRKGRIGGEIIYDPNLAEPGWVITNRSGRFGVIEKRKRTHLHSVVKLFGQFGMQLQSEFYGDEE